MNSFQAIALTLLATALTARAAPRFALVRVKDIYNALPSTTAFQQQLKNERDAILKDQRADQFRKAVGELQALQAQLADKKNPLDEVTRRGLSRTYEIKRQEAQTLQQDFESFREEREKAINRKLVTGMLATLGRIMEAAREISTKRGFDTVFDSSGNTNTGVPFVLFSKNATDLTADLQAALNAGELPAPGVNPAGAPVSDP